MNRILIHYKSLDIFFQRLPCRDFLMNRIEYWSFYILLSFMFWYRICNANLGCWDMGWSCLCLLSFYYYVTSSFSWMSLFATYKDAISAVHSIFFHGGTVFHTVLSENCYANKTANEALAYSPEICLCNNYYWKVSSPTFRAGWESYDLFCFINKNIRNTLICIYFVYAVDYWN